MLQLSVNDGVGLLRMDRAPANGLNEPLLVALLEGLEQLRLDGAGAIVLTGRPGMFSAGLDVPELLDLDRERILAFWTLFFRLTRALASSPVPVIAALSGHAPAGGAVLALHCDYRIGAEGNFRIGLNEVQVGLPVPSTILLALEQVAGQRNARRLAVRGELVQMAEAHALGLVDELAAPDELLAVAERRARELLTLPPVAMNATRLTARADFLERLAQADDAAAATAYWFSAETREGMQKLVARLRK